MIVFGGDANAECVYAPPNNFNDVWILTNADGTGGAPEWIRLSPTGPAPTPRTYHAAVYDETSNRLIVFGGNPGPGSCSIGMNDAWVLTNANGLGGTPAWTRLAPTGTLPPGRDAHSAVYDAGSNRMIVFGGQRPCGTFSDVWMLAGANGAAGTPAWTQLTPAGTVPPLMYHTAIYAGSANRMVVFGAVAPGLYRLDHANALGDQPAWSDIPVAGPAPGLRALHSAVYDPRSGGMIIFGGDAAGRTNDTWVLADAAGPQIDTPPVIACPENVTTMAALSAPGAIVEYTAPLATDDSGVVTTACTPASGAMFASGVTTVTCVATDPSGNTASCAFLVTVETPQGAARDLISDVTSAFGTPADAQPLLAKIEAAIQQLDRGNGGAARNQLQAFINQVTALVQSGRLPPTQAGEWTDTARRIIAHIG